MLKIRRKLKRATVVLALMKKQEPNLYSLLRFNIVAFALTVLFHIPLGLYVRAIVLSLVYTFNILYMLHTTVIMCRRRARHRITMREIMNKIYYISEV